MGFEFQDHPAIAPPLLGYRNGGTACAWIFLGTHADVSRAGVAELVDALDLGSSDASRGGSNPFARTTCAPLKDTGGGIDERKQD